MDVVLHYGGERFEIASEAREQIEQACISSDDDGCCEFIEVTTSVGIARFLVGGGVPIAFTTKLASSRFW